MITQTQPLPPDIKDLLTKTLDCCRKYGPYQTFSYLIKALSGYKTTLKENASAQTVVSVYVEELNTALSTAKARERVLKNGS